MLNSILYIKLEKLLIFSITMMFFHCVCWYKPSVINDGYLMGVNIKPRNKNNKNKNNYYYYYYYY